MAKLENDLKQAIVEMPAKEKDRLLLRLIAKDSLLTAKLRHQLLEDDSDMLAARTELLEAIENTFAREGFANWTHTPGLVMMVMRDFSGDITRHVKITKDKYGEIMLLTQLINSPFSKQRKLLMSKQRRGEKFATYACRKAQIVLSKLEKFEPDYYLDFEKDVNEMLSHLNNYPPAQRQMQTYGLPHRWEF